VSSRTYLSIGDVLALLRQEFPDVTISKIRFLESQGLVDPERTPSGYRKFYEHDVERLRWVLRQQREHFLPLKVIKGRLEQEVAGYGDDNGLAGEGAGGSPGRHEPVLVGRTTAPSSRTSRRELPGLQSPERGRVIAPSASPAPAGAGSTGAVGTHRRGGAPAGSVIAAPATSGSPPGAPPRGRPSQLPAPGVGHSTATPGQGPVGRRREDRTPVTSAGAPAAPVASKVPGGVAMRSTDARSGADAPGATGATGGSIDLGVEELVGGTLSGARMTVEELAQGSGLDVAAVEELESYGLLCGRVVGGVPYYDEDALIVARIAAGLARYGVEARHLRLHKHAAEREAGFIEQIVLPLLKQRNPDARQRARAIVSELTQLGQGLREVLLRTTLRDQLGG